MPSITTWTRLEPSNREPDLIAGLGAAIHDPLWLLARQWQVGEFRAEDAGSPIEARAQVELARLDTYLPGGGATEAAGRYPYDPAALPLEALVEREPTPDEGQPTARATVAAGLHFFRLLDRDGLGHYRRAYLDAYPLPAAAPLADADAAGARYRATMAGRVPDAARLCRDLRAALQPGAGRSPQLPPHPPIAAADRAGVLRAASAWLEWCAGRFDQLAGPSAWDAERLEYAFAVAAPTGEGEVRLRAAEYHGTGLDWPDFDLEQRRDPARATAPTRRDYTGLPAPIQFRGMPATRWWEFEDAALNLGAIEAGPADLGRLLLIEFALLYGDDWLVMPLPLPFGALARVVSLVVTDTFGRRTTLATAPPGDDPSGAWRMFQHSPPRRGTAAPTDWLFLPPTVAAPLRGQPIEEVAFVRDEGANIAWAIERLIESDAGFPLARTGGPAPAPPAASPDAEPIRASTPLTYRLATSSPAHWHPLLPVRPDPNRPAIRLRRGELAPGPDGAAPPAPLGRILDPRSRFQLCEEEVPAEGVRVTRQHALCRWGTGTLVRWLGRTKHWGASERSGGLRFDTLEVAPGGHLPGDA